MRGLTVRCRSFAVVAQCWRSADDAAIFAVAEFGQTGFDRSVITTEDRSAQGLSVPVARFGAETTGAEGVRLRRVAKVLR